MVVLDGGPFRFGVPTRAPTLLSISKQRPSIGHIAGRHYDRSISAMFICRWHVVSTLKHSRAEMRGRMGNREGIMLVSVIVHM